jgi:hypothetical protein
MIVFIIIFVLTNTKNDMEQQTIETLLFFAIPILLLFCIVILIDYLGKKFEDI